VMPTFKGRLKEQEIAALIAYIKTLSDKGSPSEAQRPQAPAKKQAATEAGAAAAGR